MGQPPESGQPPAESSAWWQSGEPEQARPAPPPPPPAYPPPAPPAPPAPAAPPYQPPVQPPPVPYGPPYQPPYQAPRAYPPPPGSQFQVPFPPGHPSTPPGRWDELPGGPSAAGPGRTGGRGRLVASVVAVIALVGGGAATYVAVSDSSTAGASSPEAAIRNVVTDINESDLLGVLDDLVPAERTALAKPVSDEIERLKQTNVLSSSADPTHVAGLQIGISDLTFSGKTIPLTNDVSVVEITGGHVDVSADLAKVPFTHAFLDAAFPHGLPAGSATHQSTDIAQEVQKSGEPVRIAAQKVGGGWYPSLFYTIAYQATNGQVPDSSDYIAPRGSATPDGAVKQLITDLLDANLNGAVAILAPDEMAVAHTYGRKLIENAHYQPSSATLQSITFASSDIQGGKRETLQSVTVRGDTGPTTVTIDGDCVTTTSGGRTKRLCPDDMVNTAVDEARNFGLDVQLTAAQRRAVKDVLSGFTAIGVDVSQSGGQWYVNPVRSFLDLGGELYSHVQGNDIIELIKLAQSLANK